ncbi:MAG: Ig-like domain-containing protein [Egibacteraceae bacterium]
MTQQTSVAGWYRWRGVAAVAAALMAVSLLPMVGLAQPEPVENPQDACPDEVNPPAPFTDRLQVPEAHRLNVDCAYNNDIALGFADRSFRPSTQVQRDQFASFMVRTLRAADVDLPPASDQGFTDISGNVHEDNINILAATGITAGTTSTTYSPSLPLRRDQIASFILRAASFIEDVPLENLQRDSGPFTDVPASNVHARNINGARALNLTIGRTAGTYEPGTATRRDQMASFLVRLLAALREGPLIPAEDRAETLDLTPATATNPVGTQHTVTATVRDDEAALLADANVRFEVYRDTGEGVFSGPVEQGEQRTDSQGQSGFSYTGPGEPVEDVIVACPVRPEETCEVVDTDAETEDIQFTGDPDADARVSDTATKTWVEPPPVDEIELGDGQLNAVNPLGADHTLTATARDVDGETVAGAAIRFEVYRAETADATFSGPVESATVTTDGDGVATFTYSHDAEAVDRIVVCAPEEGTCQVTDTDPVTAGTQFVGVPVVGAEPSIVATKTWQDVPPVDEIELGDGELNAVNPLGADHTLTATARFEDELVEGAAIRFEVYRAETADATFSGPVESATVTTDGDGVATFTYSHDAEAVDRIVICAPDEGTCQVTDTDAGTAGIQFVGVPVVGAEPNIVATKTWLDPVGAESLTASAFGLDVTLLGLHLLDEEPSVAIALPEPRQAEETDEVLGGLPLQPLVEAEVIEVFARGDLDLGFAQGEAAVTDLEILSGDPLDEEPLVTADAIRTISTSTCPDEGTFEEAMEGSQFVNVTVAGVELPLDPPPNTNIVIPGVAEVWINEVIPDEAGEGHGFTVRGLRVDLLDSEGADIVVAEAHSSVICN